jgi:hypothetical protein
MTGRHSDVAMAADDTARGALPPDAAALVPAVARALWAWDTLALELGDVAVVTDGHPHAELLALAATWYGALPVVRLSRHAVASSHGIERVTVDDPQAAIKELSARLGDRAGVAVVDLSGRTDTVDVLLSAIPSYTRLLLAGSAREPLTIDFYNNVHRKGIDLYSGLYDPSLERSDDHACARRLARAAHLMQRAERAAASRAAVSASASQPPLASK